MAGVHREGRVELYTSPIAEPADRQLDRLALCAGTVSTALVAGLVAVLGVVAARGLLGVEIIYPCGGPSFKAITAPQLTVAATVGAAGAAVLVQALMYVTPRPLVFFGLISALATAILTVWPFTTAADLRSQCATCVVHLALGVAISMLTATVVRHSWWRS
jgi:hypothetical protein